MSQKEQQVQPAGSVSSTQKEAVRSGRSEWGKEERHSLRQRSASTATAGEGDGEDCKTTVLLQEVAKRRRRREEVDVWMQSSGPVPLKRVCRRHERRIQSLSSRSMRRLFQSRSCLSELCLREGLVLPTRSRPY